MIRGPEGGAEMKKLIAGAALLVLILFALRRFGPAIGTKAMAKCQELMTSHRADAGAEPTDQDATAKDVATPVLA